MKDEWRDLLLFNFGFLLIYMSALVILEATGGVSNSVLPVMAVIAMGTMLRWEIRRRRND